MCLNVPPILVFLLLQYTIAYSAVPCFFIHYNKDMQLHPFVSLSQWRIVYSIVMLLVYLCRNNNSLLACCYPSNSCYVRIPTVLLPRNHNLFWLLLHCKYSLKFFDRRSSIAMWQRGHAHVKFSVKFWKFTGKKRMLNMQCPICILQEGLRFAMF